MHNSKLILNLFFLATLFLAFSCGNDKTEGPSTENTTIWSGATVAFEKVNGADPTQEANQDRITDRVWITRGNGGGQIYNAVTENESNKNGSPDGTLWALGSTADLDNLTFGSFRSTVTKPKEVVGKNLVLLLEEDDIAIDIVFTSWSSSQGGGFAYERSSN